MEVYVAIGIGLIGIYYFRRWCQGGVCYNTNRLKGKTVVITGCNTGIGKSTAVEMSRRGAKVIMACRNIKLTDIAADDIRKETGGDIKVCKLDLASLTSVRTCAKEILESEERVDILINNAGVMMCPYTKTEEGFEMQMGVNHLGHFLFTNLLLDKMKANKDHARIITLSSSAHNGGKIDLDDLHFKNKPYNSVMAYCHSKLANALFTHELAKRLKGSNVTCYAVHPGSVHTEIGRHLEEWLGFLKHILDFILLFLKTPIQGAQTTVYCATESGIESQSGKYFADCAVKKAKKTASDDEMAEKLWQLSVKEVNL